MSERFKDFSQSYLVYSVRRWVRREWSFLTWLLALSAAVAVFWVGIPVPFAWIFLVTSVACLLPAVMCRYRSLRVIARNVAILLCGLAIAESFVSWRIKTLFDSVERSNSDFIKLDADLGYRLLRNARVTEARLFAGQPVYKADYSTDGFGWRTVPSSSDESETEFVFLGGNCAFGTGVNDDQTLANQLCELHPTKVRAQLCAVSGFGPHHILSLIEKREIRPLVNGSRAHFIYVCIPDHIRRCAGLAWWDRTGPRYVLRDNVVVRDGNLNSDAARRAFSKFELLRRAQELMLGDGAAEFLARVVDRMRELLGEQYPNSSFDVVLWDYGLSGSDTSEVARLREHFQRLDLNVIEAADAVPSSRDYFFVDGHPNALAYQSLAQLLILHFEKPETQLQ